MHYRKDRILLAACLLILFSVACTPSYEKNRSHASTPDKDIAEGEELAKKYCQSCHQFPEPGLLDANTWENGVLPQMGPRLGIFKHIYQRYPNSAGDVNIGRTFYPEQPAVTAMEWQHIIDYYTSLAPDTLPNQVKPQPLQKNESLFKVLMPTTSYSSPTSCMVKIDDASKKIYISDILQQKIFGYDLQLHLMDSIKTIGTVTDLHTSGNEMIACNAGQVLPNNLKLGSVLRLHDSGYLSGTQKDTLGGQLMRPVHIDIADLNKDGSNDIAVCEFGYLKGALSWLENKNGHYERHVLSHLPGAVMATINDFNNDGLPDILALFAHGEEGIFLYTNEGNGRFKQEQLLRFPPCYGSSYFELADFNKDGHPDIVYTCGDNGDFSTILKPYHGVYVFMNDGKNQFARKYFYPVNGCYKAVARDFDGDGNLDIASIAFFADYKKQPEEGFVFLKNKGSLQFQPYTVGETVLGRWMSMDVADINSDGKPDIVLGNCSVGPTMMRSETDWKKGPPFVVLQNIQ